MFDLLTGQAVKPRDQGTYELLNVNLVLTNPRNRLLISKVRKHNYTYGSAEFIWYMAGVNSLDFITHYLPRMKEYSDDNKTLNSAYGYRIFGNHPDFPNQWRNVQYKLLADPDTRQAVITIFRPDDLVKYSKDVPCTLNLHFLIRENKLHLFTQMRSNDAYMGLVYDMFAFSLLLEHMFNFLKATDELHDLELGSYIHRSDSMHVYERNIVGINTLLEEDEPNMDYQLVDELRLNSLELPYLITEEEFLRMNNIPITA